MAASSSDRYRVVADHVRDDPLEAEGQRDTARDGGDRDADQDANDRLSHALDCSSLPLMGSSLARARAEISN